MKYRHHMVSVFSELLWDWVTEANWTILTSHISLLTWVNPPVYVQLFSL